MWTEQDVLDHYRRYQGRKGTVEQFVSDLPRVERKQKYNAVKTWTDGICFDSAKEAAYYGELKLRVLTGDIAGFLHHGKIVCAEGAGKEHRALLYEPDFVVINNDKTCEIIDTKGMETYVFQAKMKDILARYPRMEIKTT